MAVEGGSRENGIIKMGEQSGWDELKRDEGTEKNVAFLGHLCPGLAWVLLEELTSCPGRW